MITHIYTIARNEEYMLPYFLRHYSLFADKIFVIDDHSTDGTVKIAEAHPKVELLNFEHESENYDDHFSDYFTKCYKENSRGVADWVIRVDTDEFMYHEKMIDVLKEQRERKVDVLMSTGYMMVSDVLPKGDGQIYDEAKMGVKYPRYSKTVIFNPALDVTFTKGRHNINVPKKTLISQNGILLLHYRYLSKNYFIERSIHLYSRKGEMNGPLRKNMMKRGLEWYENSLKSPNLIKVI